jgi:hypothetical protein
VQAMPKVMCPTVDSPGKSVQRSHEGEESHE